ncbi:MAG: DUF4349 domain-containing protein [Candidatus Hydrothermarchaeales archaeon]
MKKIFLIVILLTILTSGCIASRSAEGELSRGFESASMTEYVTGEAMPAPQVDNEDEGIPTTRKVIVTTNIRLEIKDIENVMDDISNIAHNFDGFVSNSYVNAEDKFKTGSITIRVPTDDHDVAVKEITALGEVKSKRTSGRDVTEEYVDIEARLRNLNREEERLLEILDKAGEVKDLLEVERELARVRGEIERLTGRKRLLDDRIDYSTITVELREPAPVTYDWGVRETLIYAIEGFFATITSLIILAGYLLPIAIVLAIAIKIKRRRGSKKTD